VKGRRDHDAPCSSTNLLSNNPSGPRRRRRRSYGRLNRRSHRRNYRRYNRWSYRRCNRWQWRVHTGTPWLVQILLRGGIVPPLLAMLTGRFIRAV